MRMGSMARPSRFSPQVRERDPSAGQRASVGRAAERARSSGVAGEPRSLRRPQGLEAAPTRRGGRPLYRGPPDAALGPGERGARAKGQGDDAPGARHGATTISGDAANTPPCGRISCESAI
jgi:hypothetical protein